MTEKLERAVGRLEGRLDSMDESVGQMAKDIRHMRQVIAETRGSWKTLVALASLSAVIGGLLAKFAPFLWPVK